MKKIEKTSLNSDDLKLLAQHILEEAKIQGADSAEVSIATNKGFSVTAREGDVETVEYNQDKAIEIHVFFGKRGGSASLSDIRKEAIQAAVSAACHIAKFTDKDEAAGLATKDELAFNYPTLDIATPWKITVDEAIQMAIQCERLGVAFDPRILCAESATVSTVEGLLIHANSLDFLGCYPHTHHEISCVFIAKDKDEMQRDFNYTVATNPNDLASIRQVAEIAAERTISRLNARRLKTTKVPVIFAATEARSLLGQFARAISGTTLYRKASFLLDHLGQQIFPAFVHIEEQPHLANALGSAPFDDDAVLTRPNIFVSEGILQSYALGVYSARKLKMKTTGNAGGMHNLTIRSGDKDFQGLLKTMDKGLVITEMMGQGVNLLTGDYSRGACGFWVENGEIQYPVEEITVAGHLQDIFSRIVDIGTDVDMRGNIRTGSILIEEMMVAGGS